MCVCADVLLIDVCSEPLYYSLLVNHTITSVCMWSKNKSQQTNCHLNMPATNGIKVRAECSSKSYCRTTETNDVITLVFKYLYIIHVIKRRLKQINCICRLVCKFNPRGKRGFRLRFKIKSWCYFTFCINEVLDWCFGLKPKSKTLVLVKDEVTQQSKSYTNIKALTFPEACTSTVRLIAAWIEVGML